MWHNGESPVTHTNEDLVTKHALYRFYNDGGQLLYVGITNDPPRRMKRHSEKKNWWPKVRGMTFDWYPDRPSVMAAEKRAIRIENPLHNIQGRPEIGGVKDLPPEQRLVDTAVELFIREGGDQGEVTRLASDARKAIRDGYSWREICAGASLYGEIPQIGSLATPSYPGHMNADDIESASEAMHYLAQFIGPEARRFRASAENDPEMFNAHPYEVTIRSAEIAMEWIEEEGRDRAELIAFLKMRDPDDSSLKQAECLWNDFGGTPLYRDSLEVIEVAVSIILGAPVPSGPDESYNFTVAKRAWSETWKRCHPDGLPPNSWDEVLFDETARMASRKGVKKDALVRLATLAGSRLQGSVRGFFPHYL